MNSRVNQPAEANRPAQANQPAEANRPAQANQELRNRILSFYQDNFGWIGDSSAMDGNPIATYSLMAGETLALLKTFLTACGQNNWAPDESIVFADYDDGYNLIVVDMITITVHDGNVTTVTFDAGDPFGVYKTYFQELKGKFKPEPNSPNVYYCIMASVIRNEWNPDLSLEEARACSTNRYNRLELTPTEEGFRITSTVTQRPPA